MLSWSIAEARAWTSRRSARERCRAPNGNRGGSGRKIWTAEMCRSRTRSPAGDHRRCAAWRRVRASVSRRTAFWRIRSSASLSSAVRAPGSPKTVPAALSTSTCMKAFPPDSSETLTSSACPTSVPARSISPYASPKPLPSPGPPTGIAAMERSRQAPARIDCQAAASTVMTRRFPNRARASSSRPILVAWRGSSMRRTSLS